MNTQLGGVYKLQLRLFNTEQLTSSNWLVGALALNYRQADLLAIDYYSPSQSTVRLVWRRGGPGEIPEEDRVVPLMGDIDVSGQTTPYAIVTSIEEVDVLPLFTKKIDYKLKIVGALALIAWTAYQSMRIKNHVRSVARVQSN
jgi:hypothetical protein